MESYDKYQLAYKNYYKLKKQYDDKLKAKKKKLKGKSVVEKKIEIAKFKESRKCINCKKKGGTIFTNVGGILKVVCGCDKPCKLHIELKEPEYFNMEETIEKGNSDIEALKQKIVEYKLDLLFGLEKEEVVLQEFNTLKGELDELSDILSSFKKNYIKKNKTVVNTGDSGEVEEPIEDALIKNRREYNQLVNTFKTNIKEYRKTGSADLLKDTMQIYKDSIKPIAQIIRNMEYQGTYIEQQKNQSGGFGKKLMPIYHLHPQKILPENKMIYNSDFKVITNKK